MTVAEIHGKISAAGTSLFERMSDTLRAELKELECLQAETATELDALIPSILDRAFKGEL
jgi:hypothetical protein